MKAFGQTGVSGERALGADVSRQPGLWAANEFTLTSR